MPLSYPSTSKNFFSENEEIFKRKSESIPIAKEASKLSLKEERMDQTEYISEMEDFEDSGSDSNIL